MRKFRLFKFIVLLVLFFTINQGKAHTFQLTIDSARFYPVNSAIVYTPYDFTITMIVDANGISSNGGMINIQFPPNWGTPQDTVPLSNNYFSIVSSNNNVTFSNSFNYLNPIKGIM